MEIFLLPETWMSLISLSMIEVILGVDNLVFIAIVTTTLPENQQKMARRIGLLLAMIMRLLLLAVMVWLAEAVKPLFYVFQHSVSTRDIILFLGGLFLLIKSSHELFFTKNQQNQLKPNRYSKFLWVIMQIIVFDLLFSLDSIITAIGVAQEYWVMATAIIIAVVVMIFSSEWISRFILKNARIKVLALCILFLVSIKLILAGLHIDIPSAYIFIAMGFAVFVELVNLYR